MSSEKEKQALLEQSEKNGTINNGVDSKIDPEKDRYLNDCLLNPLEKSLRRKRKRKSPKSIRSEGNNIFSYLQVKK